MKNRMLGTVCLSILLIVIFIGLCVGLRKPAAGTQTPAPAETGSAAVTAAPEESPSLPEAEGGETAPEEKAGEPEAETEAPEAAKESRAPEESAPAGEDEIDIVETGSEGEEEEGGESAVITVPGDMEVGGVE